jgi:hypothetical protein
MNLEKIFEKTLLETIYGSKYPSDFNSFNIKDNKYGFEDWQPKPDNQNPISPELKKQKEDAIEDIYDNLFPILKKYRNLLTVEEVMDGMESAVNIGLNYYGKH